MLDRNEVRLSGTVLSKPEYKYKNYGEKFYMFYLKVVRKSGNEDILPIMISDHTVRIDSISQDIRVMVTGRVFGKKNKETKRLDVYVFAMDIDFEVKGKVDINEVRLTGYISRDIYFKSRGVRDTSDMLIASNRKYAKADYIPVVAWGRNARFSRSFTLGTHVSCVGRLQSRQFPKDDERMIYEVSLSELELEESEVSNDGETSADN